MTDTEGLSLEAQAALVQALRNPACFPHPAEVVEVLETHISWVLLAGEFAYKLKKNVNFGFLDFSSLGKRKHCCEEELRLNRRQAPDVYLEVVAIGGSLTQPRLLTQPFLEGGSTALEYAVKMRRFEQASLLDQRLQSGEISYRDIDVLAETLATFHQAIARTNATTPHGSAGEIERYSLENVTVLTPHLDNKADAERLAQYSHWLQHQHTKLAPVFEQRRQQGFVRECHGDLHLGNITLDDGHFCFFDCIEFNAELRWVDVVSELAFLVMDLRAKGYTAFSRQLVNRYFELTGDYTGAALLPYYLSYRAMIRAKVAMLRLLQARNPNERHAIENSCLHYLDLTTRYTTRHAPALIITHGLSGSGKSTHTAALVKLIGALRLRSDVERKRLFAKEKFDTPHDSDLYTAETTRTTYEHLLQQALPLLAAGLPVIIDATFLKRWQRDLFRNAAVERNVAFFLVDFQADIETLQCRIRQRQQQGGDASDATLEVLHHQLRTQEPLSPDEAHHVFQQDNGDDDTQWRALFKLYSDNQAYSGEWLE